MYGLWVHDGKLLVNEEIIGGRRIIKFPGGGLDWGEGTIACLKREFMEELHLEVEVLEHFYTTDFFQASAFDGSQVLSIYYRVTGKVPEMIVNHIPNERTFWMELKDVTEDTFTLPIDKKVGAMLRTKLW